MANPIVEEFQNLQETLRAEREQNEIRLKAVEENASTTIAEQDKKLVEIDAAYVESKRTIEGMQAQIEKDRARIEMAEALLERPRGTPEEINREQHEQKFIEQLRKQFSDPTANQELKELEAKDVELAANATGGFALPKTIGDRIDELLLKLSDVVANVRNIRVGTSDYQELVTISGANASWTAETGTRSNTNAPNLRSQKPTWGELYAYPEVSEWAAQDIFFDVADWLVNDVAQNMAQTLATAIYSGDGSDKPTGMTNGAPVTTDDHASPLRSSVAYEYIPITSISPVLSGPQFDEVIDLVYLLNPRYRANAQFAMNTVTQGFVRKLKDTNGQYLWQPSLQVGQPDRLLGYPVFTWEDLGNPTVADAFPIVFGDFSRGYLLTSRTELLTNSEGVTRPGYIRFYVRRRYGGIPLNNDALKFLKVAAS